MSTKVSAKPIFINIRIGDQLTSISCGHIIIELLKFLAYQRQQIPYSYQWLKHVVNKRKMYEGENRTDSFQSERHYQIAASSLNNLDFILKSVSQEINGSSMPEEVCIALGPTTITFVEVYRLLLPTLCHKPQCHSSCIASDQKIHSEVFKTLVTSDVLTEVFFKSTPAPTNMYVFIKKKITSNQDASLTSDAFVLSSGCRIPKNTKVIVIDLRSKCYNNLSCCNQFQIFGDVISECLVNLNMQESNEQENIFHEIESTDDAKWFQSSYVVKGFKDCVVNGESITNTWLS